MTIAAGISLHIASTNRGLEAPPRRTPRRRARARSSEVVSLPVRVYAELSACVRPALTGHPRDPSSPQGVPCAHGSSLSLRCPLPHHPSHHTSSSPSRPPSPTLARRPHPPPPNRSPPATTTPSSAGSPPPAGFPSPRPPQAASGSTSRSSTPRTSTCATGARARAASGGRCAGRAGARCSATCSQSMLPACTLKTVAVHARGVGACCRGRMRSRGIWHCTVLVGEGEYVGPAAWLEDDRIPWAGPLTI